MNRRAHCFVLAILIVSQTSAMPVAAQSVRVSGSTSFRYVELRPFVRDSVPQTETEGSGLLRQLPDGRVVRCVPGEEFCRDTRPGDRVSTVPVFQDLDVSAWGFGQGIHLYSQLRGRSAWGGNRELWPRADDAFDVLAAYAELERERFRLRAGRQWKVSGLGLYNFDGLSVALTPTTIASFEVYAGRSLVRGLSEPRTGGALESIEALAPENAGVIAGASARYRPSSRLAMSALYQVDLRDDRRGVFSELAAADGILRIGAGSLEGAVEADIATGVLNEARLYARSPPLGQFALYAEARRYRPYFELWTIWGAFSPVGFDEARSGLTWADSAGRLIVRGEASYRGYDDVASDESLDDFRHDGWGLGSNVTWSPHRLWRLDASYRLEAGFGAARRDGHAGALWRFGESATLALQGLVFQRLYEFRLDEGTVIGFGAESVFPLTHRVRVIAAAAAYRHLEAGTPTAVDWNQRRASVRLQWTLGAEPELFPRARARGVR